MYIGPRIGHIAALLLALLLAACASDAETTTAPTNPIPTVATASPAAPTAQPEPTAAAALTVSASEPTAPPAPTVQATAPAETPTPLATSLPDLPGGEWDLHVPSRGEQLAVVGVAFDDILEVHSGPGENTPLVDTFTPLEASIVSAGEGRSLPSSIWWRVTLDDVDGWVGSRFMSRLGVTLDITSQIVESKGSRPAAETMLVLGMIVADDRASDDPPSSIVVSVAPSVGDLGEIVIDVVGYPDDAVQGERLHIFGQPLDNGEGFSLMSVEATVMCRRGVSQDDLCV
jgi:hypothetical protein